MCRPARPMDTQTDPCLWPLSPRSSLLPASPHPRHPGLPVLLHGRKGAGSCGLRWDGRGRPGSPGEENKPGAPTAAGGRGAGSRSGVQERGTSSRLVSVPGRSYQGQQCSSDRSTPETAYSTERSSEGTALPANLLPAQRFSTFLASRHTN